MDIEAKGLDHKALNEAIRAAGPVCRIRGCMGQRFIGAGMSGRSVEIDGVPGNALGAYLGGGCITVHGNAQDAVGDTMNSGSIIIHGSVGDTAGYAMRGGEIYVQGNAGYRVGIHMKAYREQQPVIVIGGRTGSFLGEYQAGGTILVLGLHTDGKPIAGFSLHRAARRAGDFPGRRLGAQISPSGDASPGIGGGTGAAPPVGRALVCPVRWGCGGAAARAVHRGDAGHRQPLSADVRGQLSI